MVVWVSHIIVLGELPARFARRVGESARYGPH